MRKFVVKDKKVFEITTNTQQVGTTFAQYEIAEEVKMDVSDISFDTELVWNKVKKSVKAAE